MHEFLWDGGSIFLGVCLWSKFHFRWGICLIEQMSWGICLGARLTAFFSINEGYTTKGSTLVWTLRYASELRNKDTTNKT